MPGMELLTLFSWARENEVVCPTAMIRGALHLVAREPSQPSQPQNPPYLLAYREGTYEFSPAKCIHQYEPPHGGMGYYYIYIFWGYTLIKTKSHDRKHVTVRFQKVAQFVPSGGAKWTIHTA